jgi:hypothetical protein
MCFYPLVRLGYLIRVSRRDQDLRQQRIRVKSYRGKHLVQFGLAERFAVFLVLGDSPGRGGQHNRQSPYQSLRANCLPIHKSFSF